MCFSFLFFLSFLPSSYFIFSFNFSNFCYREYLVMRRSLVPHPASVHASPLFSTLIRLNSNLPLTSTLINPPHLQSASFLSSTPIRLNSNLPISPQLQSAVLNSNPSTPIRSPQLQSLNSNPSTPIPQLQFALFNSSLNSNCLSSISIASPQSQSLSSIFLHLNPSLCHASIPQFLNPSIPPSATPQSRNPSIPLLNPSLQSLRLALIPPPCLNPSALP
jgi:hypothetical protein